MNYMKLIKLLYLADRESLRKWNSPITGSHYVSMDKGPVLSEVLDLIKKPKQSDSWSKFIKKENYEVVQICDLSNDQLSKADVELLEEVWKEFGHCLPLRLVDIVHKLPEWQQPMGSRKSIPIDLKEILQAVGKSPSEITNIEKDAEYYYRVQTQLDSTI